MLRSLLTLFAFVATACVCASQTRAADGGLTLVVDFDATPITIRAAIGGETPPDHALPPAASCLKDLYPAWQSPHAATSLLLAWSSAGAKTHAYRLDGPAVKFTDRIDRRDQHLERGPTATRDIRVIHLASADRLAVFDVGRDVSGMPVIQQTARFKIGSGGVGMPPATIPGFRDLQVSWNPAITIQLTDLGILEPQGVGAETVVPIHGSRAPDEAFDIVVMGDGFASNCALDHLEERIRRFSVQLFGGDYQPLGDAPAVHFDGIPPFSLPGVADLVSIYLIRNLSNQSGISFCPCSGEVVDTWLGVRGNFTDYDYAADYGTDYPERIVHALEAVASPSLIEAVLVVPNCSDYGGTGLREQRLAYASMVDDPDLFTHLAIHELAHAAADIGDEYNGCSTERQFPIPYCNIATPAQLTSGEAWWTELASEDELVTGSNLKYVQECADSAINKDVLGRFARAMYVDLPGTPCKCDWNTDPRGCGYYRPEADCKMRHIEPHYPDFCRVCEHVLHTVIRRAAGSPCTPPANGGPMAAKCLCSELVPTPSPGPDG